MSDRGAGEPTVDSRGEHWCCPEAAHLSTLLFEADGAVRNLLSVTTTCPCGAWFPNERDRPHVPSCPVEAVKRRWADAKR